MCVPYWWCTKHAQLIMGNLADLQKTLPTTDLNKKKLSFDKISPRDFYFFLSFQSVLVYIWVTSRNCGCLVTCFCYQLIAKPGNKTATVSWPDQQVYIYIYIPGKWGFVSFISVQSCGVRKQSRVHYGSMVVFVCLHITITLPRYHHDTDVCECIELLKCLSGTFCRVCV